jgi:mono/diheme cytochrome c family protein
MIQSIGEILMSTLGKRILKIVGWILGSVVALVLILVLYIQFRWDAPDGRPIPQLTVPTDSASIARGEYIYKFQAQCWGCHGGSTGVNGPPSGGRVFDLTDIGPGFGRWYSPNLTPDQETGLGSWSDGQIVQALREGLNKDRATLFPIMPVDWYHGMSDEDVLSVVAYLKSLPAVNNKVPQREPSFVTKALFTFGLMKPKDPITAPVSAPPRGVTVEYGGYVARNLAGCADCHTPRNLDDGHFYMDSLFAGSSFPFGGGEEDPILSFARNITPDEETGIGSWTEEQFMNSVTMGLRPDSTVLTPHMPYAYYKSWTIEDLQAVFLYLRSLPPVKRTVPPNQIDPDVTIAEGDRGEFLFRTRCESCHGENGGGAQPTNVKLAEVSASLTDKDLLDFIAGGQVNLKMPGFRNTLKEDELNDVVAFIRTWK